MDKCKFHKAELDALEGVVGDRSAEPIAVTFSLLRHITNDFYFSTEIGRGGFAVVYLGTLPNGSRIAVKRLSSSSSMDERVFHNEVDITIKAAHENIVRLIGYCCHTDQERVELEGKHVWADLRERLICLEYVPNGTLRHRINDKFQNVFEWNQRYQILKGLCQTLSYLHDIVRVIHSDIKPENVLLQDNLVPKLFDFGNSTCLDEREDFINTTNMMGTFGYMAPELRYGRLSFKSDIYSLGVTIVELLTGQRHIGTDDFDKELRRLRKRLVKAGEFSSWENRYQQVRTCLEIGYNCMKIDPDERPTAFEIIQLLGETENTNYSVSSSHAPTLWQTGEEDSDISDTDTTEPETTADFVPSDEEPTSAVTTEETSTHEDDKPVLVNELPVSADLFDLRFLEEITDGFSPKKLLGNDGKIGVFRKAFVYKGTVSDKKMIAVKRLIGVEAKAKKFEKEAKELMSLDHKNIVKLLGYCHDESRGHKLVHYKGKQLPEDVGKKPEQLLCYEYMHNGSLHEHLTGHQDLDWAIRYELIKGTCEGLYYLHESLGDYPIVHLNLTPSNVLLDKDYVPHITGFDISRLIGQNRANSVLFDLKGEIRYLPRDYLNDMVIDTDLAKVDIYSLGLMILEIATRQEIDEQEMFIKRVKDNWREEPQLASLYTSLEPDKLWQVKLCIDIGLDCVKPMPGNRPTAGAIIRRLNKGSRPDPGPRPGVPRPPVHTNVTQEDDRTQGKEKHAGLKKLFWRK